MKASILLLPILPTSVVLSAALPSSDSQRLAVISSVDQLTLSPQDSAWIQVLKSNATFADLERQRAVAKAGYFCPCGDVLAVLCGGFGPFNQCRCRNSIHFTCSVLQFPICLSPDNEKCDGLQDTDAPGTKFIPDNLQTLVGGVGASEEAQPQPAFQPSYQPQAYSPQGYNYAPQQQAAPQYASPPQYAQPPQAQESEDDGRCIKGYNPQCGSAVCLSDPRVSGMNVNICVPPATLCGGPNSGICTSSDLICVDDPRDNCDPGRGDRSCPGICV